MRKIFLMLSVSLFSLNAEAQECVDAPSCTDLGYTQTEADCPNGSIKCPWDTDLVFCGCGDDYQYTCNGTNEIAGDSKCGDYYASCNCASGYEWKEGSCVSSRPKCNIGDIFYSDNTCVPSSMHDSSKTVLGIVVYVNPDGVGGQIMAPWWVNTSGNKSSSGVGMVWGGYGIDIPSLPNYISSSSASTDYDSCGNTDKIVAAGDASTYPAAWATRKYAPTTETAGKWCLPAAGIMTNIYNNQMAIQNVISKVGGVEFPSCCTWSSSENSSHGAWISYLANSYGLVNYYKNYFHYVRPVMEF